MKSSIIHTLDLEGYTYSPSCLASKLDDIEKSILKDVTSLPTTYKVKVTVVVTISNEDEDVA